MFALLVANWLFCIKFDFIWNKKNLTDTLAVCLPACLSIIR